MRLFNPLRRIRIGSSTSLKRLSLVLALLAVTTLLPSPVVSQPAASITFVQPDGSGDFVGEGNDYATQVWSSPWSFDTGYDIYRSRYISGLTVENGTLSGTIAGYDPYFFLLFPGMPSAINLNTGQQHPIDTVTYSRVAFRFCTPASNSGQNVRIYWYHGYTNGTVTVSDPIYVSSGCHIYTYDLEGKPNWTEQIEGLRFDLMEFEDGDTFTLDWFRLTEDNDTSNTIPIQWTGLSPSGGTLALFLDDDASGYDGDQIGAVSATASGTFTWGSADTGHLLPQDFEAGDYYVYAEVDDQPAGYSSHPLRVSQAPIIEFTNPTYTSGRDYATDHGNPWDMNNSSDGAVAHCYSYQFYSGLLDAYNTGKDPYITFNTPAPIDTSFYRYFVIEFYSQYSFYTQSGGMARVYYWKNDPAQATTTEDLVINVAGDWRTYALDMSRVPLEPVGGQDPWESNNWETFRFDPNENVHGNSWRWLIRDVKLTGPPEADVVFIASWEIDNPEQEMVTVSLYYDNDDAGFDGTFIGEKTVPSTIPSTARTPDLTSPTQLTETLYLPLVARHHCVGNCMSWGTSMLPSGWEYFLYACLDDGVSQFCRYSDVPVRVVH